MDTYYEKNKEQRKEKANAYYREHKEEILAKLKEKSKSLSPAEREAKRKYFREYYAKKKAKGKYRPQKNRSEDKNKLESMANNSNKNIKIQEYDNGIILLEYILRKRDNGLFCGQDDYLDEKKNFKLKKELERRIHGIYEDRYIAVIESNSVQVYIRNKEYIKQYINVLEEFVNEKILYPTDKLS